MKHKDSTGSVSSVSSISSMNRKQNIVFIIAFLACILIPLTMTNRTSGAVSEQENRYLASFPEPFSRSGFEDWIGDNIGLRSTFVSTYANIMYHVFGLSPSEKYSVGKDGWIFYTGDNNLRIADGTYPLYQDDIDSIIEGQKEVSDYLKSRGCRYYLILPPSKVSIYPEKLKGNYTIVRTPDDILEQAITDNTDVQVINLKQTLLDSKRNEQVFCKTDSHWNQLGAYAAYQKIHSVVSPDEKEAEVTTYDTVFDGEFSRMMGILKFMVEEKTVNTRIRDQSAVQIKYDPEKSIYVYHNDRGNGQTCVMFGDSLFGAEWNMKELLAEDFSDFIFVWQYDFDTDIIDKYEPDIVLYDMGERFVNALGDHCSIR